MHFWISKPAGRSRMIGGCRRYQASSASIAASSIPAAIPLLKSRGRHQRSRSEGSSSMVSPGINLNWSCNPRANQSQRYPVSNSNVNNIRNDERRCNNHRGQQTINIANNVANATHVQRVVPNDRGIIEVSDIGGAELAGYRLRCGVWITFVLATGFVSIAKFYFGHRPDKGLDVLIFCGLLVTLLVSGCFYSTLFRRRATQDHRHPVPEIQISNRTTRIMINDDENLTRVISGNSSPTLVPSSPAIHQVHQQVHRLNSQGLIPTAPPLPSPSPPPYHIAILIPPTNSPYEAPPPSYEKAIR